MYPSHPLEIEISLPATPATPGSVKSAGSAVGISHLAVDFKFFGHKDGQLGQIAPPLRLGDVRSYPALQGFQMAVFQRFQRSLNLS